VEVSVGGGIGGVAGEGMASKVGIELVDALGAGDVLGLEDEAAAVPMTLS
jgi:hypothetical protein